MEVRWRCRKPSSLQGVEDILMALLSFVQLSWGDDSVSWRFSSSKDFSLSSLYKVLSDGGLCCPRAKVIWGCGSPIKIRVFIWLALKDRILTYENLRKRNWPGYSGQLCPLCSFKEESLDHLLLKCSVIKPIWRFFMHLKGFPGSLQAMWSRWRENSVAKCLRPVWDLISAAVCWCIWQERNQIVFLSTRKNHLGLLKEICSLISSWATFFLWGGRWQF